MCHSGRRGARSARREECAYREYASPLSESSTPPLAGWIGGQNATFIPVRVLTGRLSETDRERQRRGPRKPSRIPDTNPSYENAKHLFRRFRKKARVAQQDGDTNCPATIHPPCGARRAAAKRSGTILLLLPRSATGRSSRPLVVGGDCPLVHPPAHLKERRRYGIGRSRLWGSPRRHRSTRRDPSGRIGIQPLVIPPPVSR